jgi:hypothetical protein
MTTTKILYLVNSYCCGHVYADSGYRKYICAEQIENFLGKCPRKIKVTLSDKRTNSRQYSISVFNKGYAINISTRYINTIDLYENTTNILRKHAPILQKKYTLYLGVQEVK